MNNTAYLIAFINYKTNVLDGMAIFSEDKPTCDGSYITTVITQVTAGDYEGAVRALKHYVATWWPTLVINENFRKPQALDGKFHGRIFRNRDGQEEKDFVVFVPRDRFLPSLLTRYATMLGYDGAGIEQVKAVQRLRERVVAWQKANPTLVKTPDAEPGECP